MPIYEYRCSECSFQDEFLQKLSEPPMSVCPSCGKASLKKLLSAAGFQLKGSGWYATDFKGSGAKPAAKPAEDAKPASGEKQAAAGEPAAKAGVEKSSSDAGAATKSKPASAASTS